MAEWLESGIAELWGGRSFRLPRCAHDRKPDGSWSAWGSDWAADVHIIETSGTASSASFTAHEMIDERTPGEPFEGLGWSGRLEVLTEQDGDRPVFRMAAACGATNTLMSLYVSYLREDQYTFARSVVDSVEHRVPSPV